MFWSKFFQALRAYCILSGYADFYRTECNSQFHYFKHYTFNFATNEYTVTTIDKW